MAASKDTTARLARVRAQIEAKREDLEAAERAPLPIEEAEPKVRAWVQGTAERCDLPALTYFATSGFTGPFSLVTLVDRSANLALGKHGHPSTGDDLSALLCAVLGEQLEEFLVARLKAHLDAQPLCLGEAEKGERLATLRRELLELEVQEERLVRELEDRGAFVARRPEASPPAVLALDLGRVLQEAA